MILNLEEHRMVEKIKGILKAGDILITEPSCYSKLNITDWIAKVSRFVQHTRWGHTSLYDGNDSIIEAKVDVLIGKGKKFDGVITRLLSDYIKEQNFIIVRPIVRDETRYMAVGKMKELMNMDNLRYDKFRFLEGGLDLLGIRTMKSRDSEESGRIICSEAIAKAYWGRLKFVDARHYSQILPTHILNSSRVSHIAVVDRDSLGKLRLSMYDSTFNESIPYAQWKRG